MFCHAQRAGATAFERTKHRPSHKQRNASNQLALLAQIRIRNACYTTICIDTTIYREFARLITFCEFYCGNYNWNVWLPKCCMLLIKHGRQCLPMLCCASEWFACWNDYMITRVLFQRLWRCLRSASLLAYFVQHIICINSTRVRAT